MRKIATTGKRTLNGDAWCDSNGPITCYPGQWDSPMTDEERELAAQYDPDNSPVSVEPLARMQRVSRARFVRQTLGLSIDEFSTRLSIPIDMLRNWERHQVEPNAAAQP